MTKNLTPAGPIFDLNILLRLRNDIKRAKRMMGSCGLVSDEVYIECLEAFSVDVQN